MPTFRPLGSDGFDKKPPPPEGGGWQDATEFQHKVYQDKTGKEYKIIYKREKEYSKGMRFLRGSLGAALTVGTLFTALAFKGVRNLFTKEHESIRYGVPIGDIRDLVQNKDTPIDARLKYILKFIFYFKVDDPETLRTVITESVNMDSSPLLCAEIIAQTTQLYSDDIIEKATDNLIEKHFGDNNPSKIEDSKLKDLAPLIAQRLAHYAYSTTAVNAAHALVVCKELDNRDPSRIAAAQYLSNYVQNKDHPIEERLNYILTNLSYFKLEDSETLRTVITNFSSSVEEGRLPLLCATIIARTRDIKLNDNPLYSDQIIEKATDNLVTKHFGGDNPRPIDVKVLLTLAPFIAGGLTRYAPTTAVRAAHALVVCKQLDDHDPSRIAAAQYLSNYVQNKNHPIDERLKCIHTYLSYFASQDRETLQTVITNSVQEGSLPLLCANIIDQTKYLALNHNPLYSEQIIKKATADREKATDDLVEQHFGSDNQRPIDANVLRTLAPFIAERLTHYVPTTAVRAAATLVLCGQLGDRDSSRIAAAKYLLNSNNSTISNEILIDAGYICMLNSHVCSPELLQKCATLALANCYGHPTNERRRDLEAVIDYVRKQPGALSSDVTERAFELMVRYNLRPENAQEVIAYVKREPQGLNIGHFHKFIVPVFDSLAPADQNLLVDHFSSDTYVQYNRGLDHTLVKLVLKQPEKFDNKIFEKVLGYAVKNQSSFFNYGLEKRVRYALGHSTNAALVKECIRNVLKYDYNFSKEKDTVAKVHEKLLEMSLADDTYLLDEQGAIDHTLLFHATKTATNPEALFERYKAHINKNNILKFKELFKKALESSNSLNIVCEIANLNSVHNQDRVITTLAAKRLILLLQVNTELSADRKKIVYDLASFIFDNYSNPNMFSLEELKKAAILFLERSDSDDETIKRIVNALRELKMTITLSATAKAKYDRFPGKIKAQATATARNPREL